MLAKTAAVLGAFVALGVVARPTAKTAAKKPQLLAKAQPQHRVSDSPLTPEESDTISSAAECRVDLDEVLSQVDAAVHQASSAARAFLDSTMAAIVQADDALATAEKTAAVGLATAGIDESPLADLVASVGAKATDALGIANGTTDSLKASLVDILSKYQGYVDTLNESLTAALYSAEEAAVVDAEQAAEAASEVNETMYMAARTKALRRAATARQRHAAAASSPKSDAESFIAKMNSTADTALEMLSKLNTTAISALASEVVDKVNSSAQIIQSTLLSGLDALPTEVAEAAASSMRDAFAPVFAAIDSTSTSPETVNEAMVPLIAAATKEVEHFQACIAPLGQMVEALDAAWPVAGSWPLLLALAAASVSRSALL